MKPSSWFITDYHKSCVYEGDWIDGQMHGNGTLTFFDMRCPHNQLLKKEFYLKLTERFTIKVEKKYTGQFKDGKIEGLGKLVAGLDTYCGDFLANEYHGKGILIRHHSVRKNHQVFKYEGLFENGRKEGYGVLNSHILYTPWGNYQPYYAEGVWSYNVLLPGGLVTCGDYSEICGDDYLDLFNVTDNDKSINSILLENYIIRRKIFYKYKAEKIAEHREKNVTNPKLYDYLHAALIMESRYDFEINNPVFRTYLLTKKNEFENVSLVEKSCDESSIRRRHKYLENEVEVDRQLTQLHNRVFHKKYFDVVPYVGDIDDEDCTTNFQDAITYFDKTQPDSYAIPLMKDFFGVVSDYLDVETKYRMILTCRAMYNLRFEWNLCAPTLDVSLEKPSVAINMLSSSCANLTSLKLSYSFDDDTVLKCYQDIRCVMKIGCETIKKRKRGEVKDTTVRTPSKLEVLDITESKISIKALRHLATPALLEFSHDNKRLDLTELHKYSPNIRKMRCSVVHVRIDALNLFQDLEDLTLVGKNADDLMTSTVVFRNLKFIKFIGVKAIRYEDKAREWNRTSSFPLQYFPALETVTYLERENVLIDEVESDYHMFGDVKVECIILVNN